LEKILILDDEISICTSLTFALEDRFTVKATTEPAQALQWVQQEIFHLCLLDLRIGQVDGLEMLVQLKELQPEMLVVMMTAYGSIASSVEAMKKGAYTYLTKPLHTEAMFSAIDQALEYQRLNRQVEYLSDELAEKFTKRGIVGNSPALQQVFWKIEKLKDLDTNVLITGESGTGKELVARALHFSGNRRKQRFVDLNCAAIPENLLESELFGYHKGAFSGAVADKAGKFEYAQQGTLFLDEIGDMTLGLQAKLLRVLQQKEVTPLGANRAISLDVRVIAATNRGLEEEVKAGTFRQDLYYRLNVVSLQLPPLREMPQDIPLLVRHFLRLHDGSSGNEKKVKHLTEEAMEALLQYQYPGNVRELGNIMESALVMAEGDTITLQDLPESVGNTSPRPTFQVGNVYQQLAGKPMEEIEAHVIEATLELNQGHRQKTAEMLGISERGLRNKIHKYGIKG